MAELWNDGELKPPAICNVKTPTPYKGVKGLHTILNDAHTTLTNLDALHKEAAYVSRFLYRYKRLFRHDKGLHNLVKMNQCFKRYHQLNFLSVIDNFKECLPARILETERFAYLPTRQMLKWVLLRLQTFSKLFVRMIELARECGRYTYEKLILGWSSQYSAFIFAVTSRILIFSRYLVLKSIEWYNALYVHLPTFQETVNHFSSYEFPTELKSWLGYVDIAPPGKKTSVDKIFKLLESRPEGQDVFEDLDLNETEEVEHEIMKLKVSDEKKFKKENSSQNYVVYGKRSQDFEDLGTVVDSDMKAPKKKKQRKK